MVIPDLSVSSHAGPLTARKHPDILEVTLQPPPGSAPGSCHLSLLLYRHGQSHRPPGRSHVFEVRHNEGIEIQWLLLKRQSLAPILRNAQTWIRYLGSAVRRCNASYIHPMSMQISPSNTLQHCLMNLHHGRLYQIHHPLQQRVLHLGSWSWWSWL